MGSRTRLDSVVLCLVTLCALGAAQCSRFSRRDSREESMAKCVTRLKAIPELAGIRAENSESDHSRAGSLKGVEIALTISGSLKSVADPNEDVDDVCYMENSVENLKKIIQALKDNGLPQTVWFVGGKDFDPKMVDLWLQSGNPIGNMSYNPKVATRLAEAKFIDGAAAMDTALAPFLKKYDQNEKYFRYPHAKPSRKPDIRDRENAFLKDNQYIVIPKTINAYDEQFALVYCTAKARGDTPCVNLIKANFLPLLIDSIQRARNLARKATGSASTKQILEIKANQFTIDTLDGIIKQLKELGVQFIPLDEAISDPLYSMSSKKGMPMAFSIAKKIEREQSLSTNSAGID